MLGWPPGQNPGSSMSADEQAEPKREQRSIQSIEIGFRLISALESSRAKMPLKLIAERAGMPASKAHLYMVSFIRLGLVVQDPVTMRYGLGPYAVQLGLAGLRQMDVLDLARTPMEELQQSCGLVVFLSVWGNMGPTIVAKFDGDPDVPLMIRVGHVLPALTSATGRVFLGLLPAAALEPALSAARATKAAVAQVVAEARREVEQAGITVSVGRVWEGLAALSAPIFDNAGSVVATITVLGLGTRVDVDPAGALARGLRGACTEVSAAMGNEAASGTKAPGPAARAPAATRRPKGGKT